MKCAALKEFLSAYANNELSPLQRELVEEHLSGCADCRKTLESYVEVKQKLTSLQTIPVTPDLSQTTTFKINCTSKEKRTSRFLRPLLITIPVIAILITLAVLQPWTPVAGPNAVIAKSIDATNKISTYRASINPFISISFPDGREIQSEGQWEFVLPDRCRLTFTLDGRTGEYIWIGNTVYYLKENTVFLAVEPYSFPLLDSPDKENIIQELESISGLETLNDETIDGVDCFHFKWTDNKQANTTIELWLGKDDYLIRQRTSRTIMTDGTIYTSIKKYYDFNQPIRIEAPVTSTGELLEGWQVEGLTSEPGQTTGTTTIKGITTTVKP